MGKHGEDLALKYLEQKGYKLLARNLRLFCGEIDLLFCDQDTLVIVEVKTKSDESFGLPQEMVNYKKKKKLLQLAKALWQKYPNKTIRIDVIAVDDRNKKIEHIVNAVEE
ncbi:MAG: YraN family protein [Patescibacteria group bacterium]|nr:YraN family protein [Patescibacteria group bacterium]